MTSAPLVAGFRDGNSRRHARRRDCRMRSPQAIHCRAVRRGHKSDPGILARWLGNKTTENFVTWAKQPDNSLLVAVENGQILAAGSVTDAGTIGRFTGRAIQRDKPRIVASFGASSG